MIKKEQKTDTIAVILLVIIASAIRILLFPHTADSPDYSTYYLQWVESFRETGLIKGLEFTSSDYYVPLNLMYAFCSLFPCEPCISLGLISMAAEFVTALYVYKIMAMFTDKTRAAYTAAFILYLPAVMINGALWKQCDSLYTVFVVISLYHLLKEDYRRSFIWLAVAFCIKLQAVFFLPLYIFVYLLEKRFRIYEFAWIPACYLIAGLPAVLCRRGIRATYLTYFAQTGETVSEDYGMVSYYPNIYNFGFDSYDSILKLPCILLTGAALIFIGAAALKHADRLADKRRLLYLGIFMAWTCLMLLPGMHERYDYAVVILATAYYAAIRRKRIWIAVSMNFCSLMVYSMTQFHNRDIPIMWVSALAVFTYICMAFDLGKELSA